MGSKSGTLPAPFLAAVLFCMLDRSPVTLQKPLRSTPTSDIRFLTLSCLRCDAPLVLKGFFFSWVRQASWGRNYSISENKGGNHVLFYWIIPFDIIWKCNFVNTLFLDYTSLYCWRCRWSQHPVLLLSPSPPNPQLPWEVASNDPGQLVLAKYSAMIWRGIKEKP